MGTRTLLLGMALFTGLAQADTTIITLEQMQLQEAARTSATVSLIDWKVGDYQEYRVTLGFGVEGSMRKDAFKEEGNAIWVRQVLKLPVANDTSEILFDRDSGKVLRYVRNGKEEKLPDEQLEIISTTNETIEVPAGKFKVLHVVAKSKNVQKIEIWMNPRDIALDGAAKVYMDQGMIKLTMELVKFAKN